MKLSSLTGSIPIYVGYDVKGSGRKQIRLKTTVWKDRPERKWDLSATGE